MKFDMTMKKSLGLGIGAVFLGLLSSCMSMQNQGTLDAIQNSVHQFPVIEAYVEYPGPQEKWAGPRSFILHIDARENGIAQVDVLPKFEVNEKPVLSGAHRGLSSQKEQGGHGVYHRGLSANLARDYLNQFATVVQDGNSEYSGCLYPIRVRLVRSNGVLTEKQGCRGYGKLSTAASDFVNFILSATQYGVTEKTSQTRRELSPHT